MDKAKPRIIVELNGHRLVREAWEPFPNRDTLVVERWDGQDSLGVTRWRNVGNVGRPEAVKDDAHMALRDLAQMVSAFVPPNDAERIGAVLTAVTESGGSRMSIFHGGFAQMKLIWAHHATKIVLSSLSGAQTVAQFREQFDASCVVVHAAIAERKAQQAAVDYKPDPAFPECVTEETMTNLTLSVLGALGERQGGEAPPTVDVFMSGFNTWLGSLPVTWLGSLPVPTDPKATSVEPAAS